MKFSPSLLVLTLAPLALLALSACGEIREDLGIGRNPPDEFAVVERPPLSMPPDYGLHPPRPGAPRPQDTDTTMQANAALFGGGNNGRPASDGEKALLGQIGTTKMDPTIRDTVDREASQKVVASPHLVDKLLSSSDTQKPATTVDAAAEAARIKKAQQDGQSVDKGATPVIEKQQSGWLGM
jgi:hypothetical protein